MKKPYQIEAQRAVKQFEAMAADGNPAVQMMLPVAEMVGWLRKGVGELVRQAGLQLMDLLMQEEVRGLVGERSQRQAERTANRWGSERGYCVVMGQKVPVRAWMMSCSVRRHPGRRNFAKTSPRRSPATMARRIAMPVTPVTSLSTSGNWMFMSLRAFCIWST